MFFFLLFSLFFVYHILLQVDLKMVKRRRFQAKTNLGLNGLNKILNHRVEPRHGRECLGYLVQPLGASTKTRRPQRTRSPAAAPHFFFFFCCKKDLAISRVTFEFPQVHPSFLTAFVKEYKVFIDKNVNSSSVRIPVLENFPKRSSRQGKQDWQSAGDWRPNTKRSPVSNSYATVAQYCQILRFCQILPRLS